MRKADFYDYLIVLVNVGIWLAMFMLVALALSGCMGVSGRETITTTHLRADGTVDRVETNERVLRALTILKDLDLGQVSWGDLTVNDYSSEVSPEFVEALEAMEPLQRAVVLKQLPIAKLAKILGMLTN